MNFYLIRLKSRGIFTAVAFNVARWRSGLTHMPFTHAFRGSNPLRVTIYGRLAQLGEHLPYKQGVGGSIPSAPTIYHYRGVEQFGSSSGS
jgi:hypothetical protein